MYRLSKIHFILFVSDTNFFFYRFYRYYFSGDIWRARRRARLDAELGAQWPWLGFCHGCDWRGSFVPCRNSLLSWSKSTQVQKTSWNAESGTILLHHAWKKNCLHWRTHRYLICCKKNKLIFWISLFHFFFTIWYFYFI